ncbi:hypothetical protein DFH06DRAFT_1296603 [Mycena polygramma]|nr:hypothetical protein DFH06DRAFT_1296603 [Mycena polygramma]
MTVHPPMKSDLKKYFAANRAEPVSPPRRRSQAQRDIDRKEKARLRMAKSRAELKTRPLEEQAAYAARSRAYQERYRARNRTRLKTILAEDDISTGYSASYSADSESTVTKKTQLSYILCAGSQEEQDNTASLQFLNTSAEKKLDAVSQHPVTEDSKKTQLSYILCPGTESETPARLGMPRAHPDQNISTGERCASATRFRAHGPSRENRSEREMVLTQIARRREQARLRMANLRAELKTRSLEEQAAVAARSRGYQAIYREKNRESLRIQEVQRRVAKHVARFGSIPYAAAAQKKRQRAQNALELEGQQSSCNWGNCQHLGTLNRN